MRQISKRAWLITIAGGTILALLGLLYDLLKGALANVFPSLPLWIILVGIAVVVILIATFGAWYDRLKSTPEMSADTVRENRQNMLGRVQNKWIAGFLENPLYYSYEGQLLPVPLRERVGSRFDLVLSNPLEPTQTLPPGTTLAQVFDDAGGELLILGEPGAGKTTRLLELTRDLLKRATDNPMAPMPVVLVLASFASRVIKKRSLENLISDLFLYLRYLHKLTPGEKFEKWIVEELRNKYDIPSQIGEAWVKANQLLLLLDGLDEVAPSALLACIEAINEYYHQAQRSLVVCSRTKEFLGQPGRLALHTAVIVQPLSSSQVDTYLDDLAAKGEDVTGLKHVLHQSTALSALATTPYFLTVLLLAYHGKPVQELLALVKVASTDQQHLIFHDYVERILRRTGARVHATALQTKHWLAWLACQMTAHQQSELYLEQLQLDWLPKRQRAYYWWSIGLLAGLVFGLFSGPVLVLVGGLVGGLLLGLGAAIPHYALRFWLWQAGRTPAPWRYIAFLDDAVEQRLLRKVGGGYLFQHRLLQDYFASLDVVSGSALRKEPLPPTESQVQSYVLLRRDIGIIGMVLPFVLIIGKIILESLGISSSTSAYYYSVMGDVFVGSLGALSIFLLCYRYDLLDDIVSIIAGICAIGVVLFPTAPDVDATQLQTAIGLAHASFASYFFLILALMAIFLFRRTDQVSPTRRKQQRNTVYLICGIVILACVVLADLTLFVPYLQGASWLQPLHPIFWLESFAILAFGFAWFVKGETFILKDE